jgi:hypothetical protein
VTFDPRSICRALNDEGVRFIVVGGFAAVLHGSPLPTSDIDVVPRRDPANLERLARALTSLGAQLRTAAGPVATTIDAGFLDAMPLMVNLSTDHGDLDLTFAPTGPRQAWDADAGVVEIAAGLSIRVASLDAVIDSKRAAARVKDVRALPEERRAEHRLTAWAVAARPAMRRSTRRAGDGARPALRCSASGAALGLASMVISGRCTSC